MPVILSMVPRTPPSPPAIEPSSRSPPSGRNVVWPLLPVIAGGCPLLKLVVFELLFTARETAPTTTEATSRIIMILNMVFMETPFYFNILKVKVGRACAQVLPAPSAPNCPICSLPFSWAERPSPGVPRGAGTSHGLGSLCSGQYE